MNITACNDEFLTATVFYARALGIAHYDVSVTVDYGDDADMAGAAQILYYKGEAVITINTTQTEGEDEMELLAHEMVHLKQYVTGQMVDNILDRTVVWEGTVYDVAQDANSWAYWNAPWELEAYSRQRGLNHMRTVK